MTIKRGTDNIRNQISEDDVIAIYTEEKLSQTQMAKKYNISQSSISHIRNKRTWKWLTDKYDQGELDI